MWCSVFRPLPTDHSSTTECAHAVEYSVNMPVVVISTNLPRAAIPDNFLEDVTDLAIKMLQKPKKVIDKYFILQATQLNPD